MAEHHTTSQGQDISRLIVVRCRTGLVLVRRCTAVPQHRVACIAVRHCTADHGRTLFGAGSRVALHRWHHAASCHCGSWHGRLVTVRCCTVSCRYVVLRRSTEESCSGSTRRRQGTWRVIVRHCCTLASYQYLVILFWCE